MLLRSCSIEYLLQDKQNKRTYVVNADFQDEYMKHLPYDNLIDLLNREGIQSLYQQNNLKYDQNNKDNTNCMLLK